MPQVPLSNGPRVQTQALSNAKFSAEAPVAAFGGGSAAQGATDALGSTGQAFEKHFEQEKVRADTDVVQSKYLDLIKKKNDLQYNPERGLSGVKGEGALKASVDYLNELDKHSDDVYNSLTNDYQKQLFKQKSDSVRSEFSEFANKHAFIENNKYRNEQSIEGIKVLQDDSVLNYQDPKKLRSNLDQIEATFKDYAVRNGMSPEEYHMKLQDAKSGTHLAIFNRMLANKDTGNARSFLEKNKDAFNGDDVTKAEGALKTSTDAAKVFYFADNIFKNNSDMEVAMEDIRKHVPAEYRDRVESQILQQFSIKEKNAEIDRGKNVVAGFLAVDENGDTRDIPPHLWDSYTDNQKKAMEIAAARKKTGIVKNDENVYHKYNALSMGALARVTEPELAENLYPYVDGNSYKKILDKWQVAQKANQGDPKAKEKMDDEVMKDDRLLKRIRLAGIKDYDSSQSTGKQKVSIEYSQLKDTAEKEFQAYYRANGKNPDPDVQDKIVDRLLSDRVNIESGWFSSKSLPRVMVKPEDREKVRVPLAEMDTPRKLSIINLGMANIAGIPRGLTAKQFETKYKSQLEKAYGLASMGASKKDILKVFGE